MTDYIVEVDFGHDPSDLLTLRWRPRSTPVAHRWLSALRIATPLGIHETDRFYNFPHDGWDRRAISDDLNRTMEIISTHYGEVFDGLRAAPDMSQEHFNRLHTYFEVLRGSIQEPSAYFLAAPDHVKLAIERYNVLIHRWEDHEHEQERLARGSANPRFVVTFKQKQRASLEEEDYQHFTFAHDFGAMRINYCMVGKPLYDVWKDGDEDVGDEAIRPLSVYSADFNVSFGEGASQETHERIMADIWEWFDRKSNFMTALGFHKHDPKLALGHLVVADLVTEHDPAMLVSHLTSRRRVAAIRIVEAD